MPGKKVKEHSCSDNFCLDYIEYPLGGVTIHGWCGVCGQRLRAEYEYIGIYKAGTDEPSN